MTKSDPRRRRVVTSRVIACVESKTFCFPTNDTAMKMSKTLCRPRDESRDASNSGADDSIGNVETTRTR